jgi:hypothetical protein
MLDKGVFKMNKKAVNTIGVIMALVLGLFMVLFMIWWVTSSGEQGFDFFKDKIKAISDDCDKDQIANELDRCPCISTGGEGYDTPSMLGCPKTLTTLEAEQDRQTCYNYYDQGTLIESEGKVNQNTATCDPDGKEKTACIQRCEHVKGVVAEVPLEEDEDKGFRTNGDLVIIDDGFSVEGDGVTFNDGKYTANLENKEEKTLKINFKVENQGTDNIVHEFSIQASVCDKHANNCMLKDKFEAKINGLKANYIKPNSLSVTIGNNGDYCDKTGKTSCWVKLVVDSKDDLQEFGGGETNNEKGFLINLENQEGTDFNKFVLGMKINDGSDGGLIDEYCPIGKINDMVRDYPSCALRFFQDLTSQVGTFPSESGEEKGTCWILSVYDGDWRNDYLGAGKFEQGKTIPYLNPEKLTPLEPKQGNTNALKAFNYEWKANPDGSLICSAPYWYQCDSDHNDQVLYINEKRFLCQNKQWVG